MKKKIEKIIFINIFVNVYEIKIVENQDLYRKKDDIWKKKFIKKILTFHLKDFMIYKNICKMYKL